MPNFHVKYEHTVRNIYDVYVRKFNIDFNEAKSKKSVIDELESKAKLHKLENFKIISIEKFDCLECFDTGMSKYNGCACC